MCKIQTFCLKCVGSFALERVEEVPVARVDYVHHHKTPLQTFQSSLQVGGGLYNMKLWRVQRYILKINRLFDFLFKNFIVQDKELQAIAYKLAFKPDILKYIFKSW